jgi:flavin-binding protein dodecin
VRDVSVERVHKLSESHGIDLHEQLRTPRRNLYRRFLEHCLLDCSLTEEEAEELTHLRKLLHLGDSDVAHVHDAVSRAVYGAALGDVLDDHRLDEDEERFLKHLRDELGMSEVDATRMYEEEARRAQQRLLSTTPHGGMLASREGVVELKGGSTVGLQDAIQAVVDESCHALPNLSWAELSELRVRIESGHIAEWQIKLKAGLGPPPNSRTAGQEAPAGP